MKLNRNFKNIQHLRGPGEPALNIERVRGYEAGLPENIHKIIGDAWKGSEWFTQVDKLGRAAVEAGSNSKQPYAALVGRDGLDHIKRQVRRSILPGSNLDFITARFSGDTSFTKVGYARIVKDASGNPIEQTAKRLFARDHVFACIGDVNVLPEYQQKNVAVALVDAGLSLRSDDTTVTTYVANNNQELLNKLASFDFTPTGEQERLDIYGDSGVLEVRLEGPTVGVLRGMLHEKYQWLDEARIS